MWQDLQYAIRILKKAPGFTAVVILTLALGIGANTAVFSVIEAVLLRPLPYKDPRQLVAIWDRGVREKGLAKIFDSYADFKEFESHSRSFEQIAAATWAVKGQILTGRGPARTVMVVPVSASFFSLLGVAPAVGRTFDSDDLTRGCSVILSHRFWATLEGRAQAGLPTTLTLDKRPCTVLGVMPVGFAFYPEAAMLWTLITPDFTPPPDKLLVGIFGRLKQGVTKEAAEAELTALHNALHMSPGKEREIVPAVYDVQQEFTWLAGRNLRTTLLVLLAAVSLVLLIGCLNVANLLLGRAFTREREFAVRAALGSGRVRLLRQLLTEGLVLSFVGGSVGVLVAIAAVRWFIAVNPIELPPATDVRLRLPVLAFAAAVAIISTLLFGLVPAWKSSRVDFGERLKAAGRGSASGRGQQGIVKTLVIAEMAFSVVLLIGAVLLVQSVLRMASAPLGYDPDHLTVASTTLPQDRYSVAAPRIRFYDELKRRISRLPGVEGVALSSSLPPFSGGSDVLQVEGRPVPSGSELHDVGEQSVSPEYFRVLGEQLLLGRSFDMRDRLDSEPVAVVNEALTRQYFGDMDPLGKRIRVARQNERNPWLTIVGVVANEKSAIVYQEMNWLERPVIFRPIDQDSRMSFAIAIRTSGGQNSIGTEIQREVSAVDNDVPASIESMQTRMSKYLAYPRFRAVLFIAFGGFALLLANIGLHGVLTQFVVNRTQEIGVRVAIGAQSSDVVGMIAKQGGVPVVAGLAIGLLSAVALGRYLTSLLYGVQSGDLLSFAGVSLTMLATAAAAIWIPARRAAKVDPMVALRDE